MALSENQVRHFYVLENKVEVDAATKLEEQLVNPGDFAVRLTKDEEDIYLQHVNALGEITRTDIIPVCNIFYVNATPAEAMVKHPKKAIIKFNDPAFDVDGDEADDNKVAAGTYVVRVTIENYIGMSDDAPYYKYGQVTSNGKLTYPKFFEKLAKSLEANFSREAGKLFNIEHDDESVTLTEAPQPWRRGVLAQEPVKFSVALVPNDTEFEIEVDKETNTITYDWGNVQMDVDTETTIQNSKDIADMEWFCMGERADIYRGKGWPYNIETNYMVNPKAENGYNVIDIQYAYQGTCEDIQKSEKTLTLVMEKADLMDSILELIETYAPAAKIHKHEVKAASSEEEGGEEGDDTETTEP